MKLHEMDWNKLSGAEPKPHQSGGFYVRLEFHPNINQEEVENEIDELKLRIDEMVGDAIEDKTTLITGIHFE